MTIESPDFASKVHAVVAAVAPIASVAIGRRNDRATWRIDFKPEATVDQRLEAERIVREFDALSVLKTRLMQAVDADAEVVRQRYITPGDGMQMVYAEKFAQAQAVHAMGEAAASAIPPADSTAQFPTLAASVGIEAETLYGCAMLVLGKYAAFAQRSYAIERTRLLGKRDIAAAADAAAAQAVYEALTWTT